MGSSRLLMRLIFSAFAVWWFPLDTIGAEFPPPRFDIVLQRNSLRLHDAIPFDLWMGNSSAQPLEDVRLSFSLPAFLTIAPKDCNAQAVHSPIAVGNIPPQSVKHETLCLRVDSPILEGNTRLAFALEYRWKTDKGTFTTSYILQKEVVEVSLFGTGTVAGVPLSLLAYLVPGVLLLILLRFLDMPRIGELSSIEVGVLVVLFSIVMVIVFSAGYGHNISTLRFAGLCLLSLLVASVFTLPLIYCKVRQRWHQALLIEESDPLSKALWKAFKAKKNRVYPIRVILKSGQVLVGSMAADSVTGIVLFGWFRVQAHVDREALAVLEKEKKFFQIVEAARQQNLAIEPDDYVQSDAAGHLTNTREMERIAKAEIDEGPIQVEPDAYAGFDLDRPPLIIAKGSTNK